MTNDYSKRWISTAAACDMMLLDIKSTRKGAAIITSIILRQEKYTWIIGTGESVAKLPNFIGKYVYEVEGFFFR